MTLLGAVPLQRHYYHCPLCRQGFAPWDSRLGLQAAHLSPAAERVVCLTGIQSSFREASGRALYELTGLRMSESTVERTTEATGQRLGEAQAAGQTVGPAAAWAWHKDAEGKTCAYVSIDATGVAQQGPQAAKAEGRMAYVGMVYNPVPEEPARWADPHATRRPAWQARYLAGLDELAAFEQPLRRQAAQVGMDQAERWIALSDGGAGLEDFVQRAFPRVAAVILDFYHVAEHLHAFAKCLHPGDEAAAQTLGQDWCHRLKHEGGRAVQALLEGMDLRGRKGGVREEHRQLVGYFANQVHRMDYPTYRAQGWQIGSGPVESACKTVVGQRLKGAGMRWGADGADAVCHLRALFRSEPSQWEAFWNPKPN